MDIDIFQKILSNKTKTMYIGWQSYFIANYQILPFHKFANFIIFITIPFTPTVAYCIIVIRNNLDYISTKFAIQNQLPLVAYVIYLTLSLIVAIYASYELWKIDSVSQNK